MKWPVLPGAAKFRPGKIKFKILDVELNEKGKKHKQEDLNV